MSDKELIDEITTLIVAGHETTASMLNWTWYLLGGNPQVRGPAAGGDRRPADDAVPSLESMEELHYGNLVLQEALRLYPPVLGHLPSHDRAGRTGRLCGAGRHGCIHQPLLRAPASAVLAGPGALPAGALCSPATEDRNTPHLPALLRRRRTIASARPWPSTRADPPVQGGPPLPPAARIDDDPSSSRRRSTCAPASRSSCGLNAAPEYPHASHRP